MILKKLEVKEMFGVFNYTLDLSRDITIITAPNGYGKTICLKIIHSIFSFNFMYFSALDFEEISLITDVGRLSIRKVRRDKNTKKEMILDLFDENENFDLEKSYDLFGNHNIEIEEDTGDVIEITFKNGNTEEGCFVNLTEHQDLYRRNIDELYPFLSRVDYDRWMDIRPRNKGTYNLKEIMETFEFPIFEGSKLELPDWLREFSKSQKTYFVQDQRLILKKSDESSREDFFTNAIEKYSEKLKYKIRDSSVKVSQNSQKLDSTFPHRLVNNKHIYTDFDKNNLIKELEFIQDKRKKLMKYDLLSQDNTFDNEIEVDHIEDNDVKVLNLYIKDTNKKLSSFDSIYEKINTFVEILNKKLIFKRIKINSSRGFYFVRDIDNNDSPDKLLSLSKLSSGEQHQVVLLYQLIFNTDSNTLVLIDEPEISLHVVWQKQFMEDLLEISKINNMKSIIATHSPQIIGDKWDSTIDLEDLRKKQVNNL